MNGAAENITDTAAVIVRSWTQPLPAHCTAIQFDHFFNDPPPAPGVTVLPVEGSSCNDNSSHSSISQLPFLTHITTTHSFDQSLIVFSPCASLTHLTLSERFNHSLAGVPQSLQHLTIGNKFDQSLDDLIGCQQLLSLSVGHSCVGEFNQPITAAFVAGCPLLQQLTLSHHFDQSIDALADAHHLTTLTFLHAFNQSIAALSRCQRLHTLQLGNYSTASVDTLHTSQSLTSLKIADSSSTPILQLSPRLLHLHLGTNFGSFDAAGSNNIAAVAACVLLQTLTFSQGFNGSLSPLSHCTQLTDISFSLPGGGDRSHFNQSLTALSELKCLRSLQMGNSFSQSIAPLNNLPSLTLLTLGDAFCASVDDVTSLPALTHLTLGPAFNLSIAAVAAACPALTHFSAAGCFDQPITALGLCTQLQHVSFAPTRMSERNYFNHNVAALAACQQLTTLQLGHRFDQPLIALAACPLLTSVTVGGFYRQKPLPLRCGALSAAFQQLQRDEASATPAPEQKKGCVVQ